MMWSNAEGSRALERMLPAGMVMASTVTHGSWGHFGGLPAPVESEEVRHVE
jgi:hypothetical protein